MPETRQHEVYRNGALVSSTPYEVSDADLDHERAATLLRAAYVRMGEIATQADAVAAQGANVSQAQIKGLFSAVADEARALRRLVRYVGRQLMSEDVEG
jgi:hypothetical protein